MSSSEEDNGTLVSSNSMTCSLPAEVISYIFETCVNSDVDTGPEFPELLLSHVCRLWRAIALGTPTMWTTIYLIAEGKGVELDRAHTYLERSGAVPLRLRIDFQSESSLSSVDRICGEWTRYIDRWQHLRVSFATSLAFEPFVSSLSTACVPQLRSCHIAVEDHENWGYGLASQIHDSVSTIFTSGAPSLVSFGLQGLALHRCLPPLETLTNFRIHYPNHRGEISLTYFASMMNTMLSLTHLIIDGDNIDEWTPPDTITLPCLSYLQFCAHSARDQIARFLAALRAPFLQNLLLDSIVDEEIDSMENHLDPLAFPSLYCLTLVTWTGRVINAASWTKFSFLFTSIKQFVLLDYNPEPYLSALSKLPSRSGLPWPELHTLSLVKRRYEDGHDSGMPTKDALLKFLSNRAKHRRPIQMLQLSPSLFSGLGEHLQKLHPNLVIENSSAVPEYLDSVNVTEWPYKQHRIVV